MKPEASPPIRPSIAARPAALSILSIALAFGCGNNPSNGSNGGGTTGGDGTAVLCTLVFGADANAGFIRLVSDEELESGEVIDSTAGGIELAGGGTCAVQGRSVFALRFESPTITRFEVENGEFVAGDTVSFANFGLSALAFPPVFISDTKAYYLDIPSSQIIVWDPRAMEAIGAIALTPSDPPEGLRPVSLRANLIDGLFVVYNAYQNEQGILTSRTDFWFVDPTTDQIVATDTIEECGNLQQELAIGGNDDTYISTSTIAAMEHALGLAGSFPPCAVRIRAGAQGVDTTYLADLNALAGAQPAGGVFGVGEDRALMVAYNTGSMPIDPSLTARELVQLVNWNFYEWAPGSEQPATLVESIPTGTGRQGTRQFDGTTFLLRNAPGFSSTELLDLTQAPLEVTYTFTNALVGLSRLGRVPDARMVQRIERPRSLTLLEGAHL